MRNRITSLILITFINVTSILIPFSAADAATHFSWDFSDPNLYSHVRDFETAVSGGLAQLVLSNTPSPEAVVFDDASTLLTNTINLDVEGNYAYVTSFIWAHNSDGFEILDISDPSNPVHVGSFIDDGTSSVLAAWGIDVVGNYAYLTSYGSNSFTVVDVSNPASPTFVADIIDDATTALANPRAVRVVGNYAYVSSEGEAGIEIIDISNPLAPVHAAAIFDDPTTLMDQVVDLRVSGNYLYATSKGSEHGLEIIDISNPLAPVHVGSLEDDASTILNTAHGLAVSGNYAYVLSGSENGLAIIDVSNPGAPFQAASIVDDANSALTFATDIEISGNYAYITGAAPDHGLTVIDISNPTNPSVAGVIYDDLTTALSDSRDVKIVGNYAYLPSANDHGFQVLNLNPAYSSTFPYVQPISGVAYTNRLSDFSETLGSENSGNTTYQISNDDGSSWFYFDGTNWLATSAIDGSQSNPASSLSNDVLESFVQSYGAGTFLWRAFFESDGSQKVELDLVSINIDSSSSKTVSRRSASNKKPINVDHSTANSSVVPSVNSSNICKNQNIITDLMKNGDNDGVPSDYNNGTVTQIHLLQAYINDFLNDDYGPNAAGPVDGIFRSLTQVGVKRIQMKLNELLPDLTPLIIDGIVGPNTRQRINLNC